jgi:hypothetical protein
MTKCPDCDEYVSNVCPDCYDKQDKLDRIAKATSFCANQQRGIFKMNWKSELELFMSDLDTNSLYKICDFEGYDTNDLLDWLEDEIDIFELSNKSHYFTYMAMNLRLQYDSDRETMIYAIIEEAKVLYSALP